MRGLRAADVSSTVRHLFQLSSNVAAIRPGPVEGARQGDRAEQRSRGARTKTCRKQNAQSHPPYQGDLGQCLVLKKHLPCCLLLLLLLLLSWFAFLSGVGKCFISCTRVVDDTRPGR